MKIPALITSLVLGLGVSTAAMADSPNHYTSDVRDHREVQTQAPEVRDHRQVDPGYYRQPVRPRWVTLASSAKLSRGHKMIDVSSSKRFNTLSLKTAGWGSMDVEKVVITFGDGEQQVVDGCKQLSSNSPLSIDLNGRNRMIDKIAIFGKGNARLTVLAS